MTSMYILRIDDRPTDLAPWKISNGHISATDHPTHIMFSSTVGFFGSANRMALLEGGHFGFAPTGSRLLPAGANPKWTPAAIFENFEWPYL